MKQLNILAIVVISSEPLEPFGSVMGREKQPEEIELMTTAEAAKFLRLSPQTLRYWRCYGMGPKFYKVGGRATYDKADLLAMLRQAVRVPSVASALEETA